VADPTPALPPPLSYSQLTGIAPFGAVVASATSIALRALCVLLLVLATPWPAAADDGKPLTAILLVARDDLPDSAFGDSTVLVLNNLGPSPAGIIINRPTPLPVSELFPELKSLARLHDKVYFGGPVDFGSVWFVFRAAKAPAQAAQAVQVCDGVYLSGSRELLLQLLGREKPMEGLRIFVGHSGWAPGQLEAEIAAGDWRLEHADSEAIFNGKSEHPWPPSRNEASGT
jgi:putative transcriptional regulator